MKFLFPQAFCLPDATILSLFNNRCNITNKRELLYEITRCVAKYLNNAGTFECVCFFVFHGICGFLNYSQQPMQTQILVICLKVLVKSEEFLFPNPNPLLQDHP